MSNGRGYLVSDLEQLRALGTGAAYAAVVVMTLYINDPDEQRALPPRHPAVAGGAGAAAVAEPGVDAEPAAAKCTTIRWSLPSPTGAACCWEC